MKLRIIIHDKMSFVEKNVGFIIVRIVDLRVVEQTADIFVDSINFVLPINDRMHPLTRRETDNPATAKEKETRERLIRRFRSLGTHECG